MTGPVVYRLYGADGQLLYIGSTSHFHQRMRQHKRSSLWWRWAVRSTVTRYESRALADAAEAHAIIAEHPLFNQRIPRNALAKAA